MLLGKRARPPMKRTTSMSEFSNDNSPPALFAATEDPVSSAGKRPQQQKQRQMASPRNPRRHSGDFAVEAAHFLRECGLCKRRLGPGRDTFMYRGEIAFCSLDCRQKQMTLDERKDRCSIASASKNPFHVASPAANPTAATEATAI